MEASTMLRILLNILAQTPTVGPSPTPTPEPGIIFRPEWGAIGTILGVITGLIAIYQFVQAIRQRTRKKIGHEIRSDSPLLSFKEIGELSGRLTITFEGTPMERLTIYSLVLRISNRGNVEIKQDDYSGPIRINLGQDDHILTTNVLEANPPGLVDEIAQKISFEGRTITIQPVLLNKGQSFTIRALVRGSGERQEERHLEFYAPIAGIEVEDVTKTEREARAASEKTTALLSSVGTAGPLLLAVYFFTSDLSFSSLWSAVPLALVIIVSFAAASLTRPTASSNKS